MNSDTITRAIHRSKVVRKDRGAVKSMQESAHVPTPAGLPQRYSHHPHSLSERNANPRRACRSHHSNTCRPAMKAPKRARAQYNRHTPLPLLSLNSNPRSMSPSEQSPPALYVLSAHEQAVQVRPGCQSHTLGTRNAGLQGTDLCQFRQV